MIITPLDIDGAYRIQLEPFIDKRGSFARQFCQKELKDVGIDIDIRQCNISKNNKCGTLRGMHYQKMPYPEKKIVSCIHGAIYDVIVDIRPESPTFLMWTSIVLTEENNSLIYIPPGVAHGFQTLVDNAVVYYQLGEFFMPEYYAGVRWDDPAFGIKWPDHPHRIINERDMSYELFR